MATDKKIDARLMRLREALVSAGVVRGTRDKTVASVTGYAEASVRGILSGHSTLTDRFIKIVCSKFNIRFHWVDAGEQPMFVRPGEQPYPGGGYSEEIPKIAGVDLPESKPHAIAQPIAGLPYPRAIAGPEASVPRIAGTAIAGYPATPRVITEKIEQYYTLIGEAELGKYMALALWEISALTKQEIIDLIFQVRKIAEGHSDKLATLAADERFERSGIKPSTRLKLERIPVEPEDENQEK